MNVSEKIKNDAYTVAHAYPSKPVKPLLPKNASSVEARAYADALADYEKLLEAYNVARDEWRAESNRLNEQFRTDVEAEYEMTDHPKRDLLWSKAYDHGHSAGYGEVLSWYDDLHDLID